jgi:hypothetical protein
MASRRPLVNVSGSIRELPSGDTLPGVRELLTAARTYYVRTDGSDSNTGLSNTAGGAFATIQKAVDVASALDNGGFNITIQIADGTYSAGASLKSFVGSGQLSIRGNSGAPQNVVISTGNSACFSAVSVQGRWFIGDLATATGNANHVIASGIPTFITLGKIYFGAANSAYMHVYAEGGARVFLSSDYSITGGAGGHWYAFGGASIEGNVITCTLSGTPAFALQFFGATNTGILRAAINTYSGAATGKRYDVKMNAVIDVNGAGASYLPGNAAGTSATGGQYA